MSYAIELCFDKKGEQLIEHYWEILCQHKLSSFFCELPGGRPHISLAIYHQADVDLMDRQLSSVLKDRDPIKLSFTNLGIFPTDPGIVFLAPSMTEELFQLHKDYHQLAKPLEASEWNHYKPNLWVPHCTLANDIQTGHLSNVINILLPLFQPFDVTVTEVELVEFLPVRSIRKYKLG